jgi:hypothetical protein
MAIDADAFPTRSDLGQFVKVQIERFTANLVRADGLVEIYNMTSFVRNPTHHTIGGVEGRSIEVHFTDILRAAVVLVHATLEDLLRSMAATLLPFADEATLNTVPLAGSGSPGRAEKFFLGRLAAHRGKSVLGLIKESVDDYLTTTTYNDTSQISALLVSLEIDVEKVKHLFPKLDEVIKRRHQIVHRADRTSPKFDASETIESIAADQVKEWISAVQEFMAKSITSIASRVAAQSK